MNILLKDIRELVLAARKAVVHSVDLIQVLTNYEIGRRIVEHEQQGAERAAYGEAMLKELATALTDEFGKGFSLTNLKMMRKFFMTYRTAIGQTASGLLMQIVKGQTPSDLLRRSLALSQKSAMADITQMPSAQFTLSWSHYVFLMGIKNAGERGFYEIEAASQGWSLRELKRQFNSGLYERLALSRDKDGVRKLAEEGQIVARQKRFTFDEEHFFVDLVFYNRLLRCYVLIDLKLVKLTTSTLARCRCTLTTSIASSNFRTSIPPWASSCATKNTMP